MLKQVLISTAISAALLSAPLVASEKTMGDDKSHMTGQSSAGGYDTRDQAGTSVDNADFDRLDLNKDGKLDESELNRFGATAAGSPDDQGNKDRGARMMKQYDRDGDGSVTNKEFGSGSQSTPETTLDQ